MSAQILGRSHWHAAQQRRYFRNQADRQARLAQTAPRRLSLDEILGPAFDPSGDAA